MRSTEINPVSIVAVPAPDVSVVTVKLVESGTEATAYEPLYAVPSAVNPPTWMAELWSKP